jgi:hypothetical protein
MAQNTGNARQEAGWEKDNGEKTWRHRAHEIWPREIRIIRRDDVSSRCVRHEEACPEILCANLMYHPYKMQVVQRPSDNDNIAA